MHAPSEAKRESLNVTCPYRLGGRLFGMLTSNFAVYKRLGWSVAGMSTDISHRVLSSGLLRSLKYAHITINNDLQTETFQKENSIKKVKTALLATFNFTTINSSFSVTLCPLPQQKKCMKSHLWRPTISIFFSWSISQR